MPSFPHSGHPTCLPFSSMKPPANSSLSFLIYALPGPTAPEGAFAKWRHRVMLRDQRRQQGLSGGGGGREAREGGDGDGSDDGDGGGGASPSSSSRFSYPELWPKYWAIPQRQLHTPPPSPLRPRGGGGSGEAAATAAIGGGGGGTTVINGTLSGAFSGMLSKVESGVGCGMGGSGGRGGNGGAMPAVVCQTADGMPWRRLATAFTGGEGEPDDLPTWLVDAVLRGVSIVPKVCWVWDVEGEGRGGRAG